MIKTIDYQVEIEKLLKNPKIKEYSELPGLQFLKEYDLKLYYEDLLTRYKELEKQQPCTHQKPPHADPLHLYFIHNTRHFSLLKEKIECQVFIDKLLIIISHEFLLFDRQEIDISLEKLCSYLCIQFKKPNVNYIRRKIKAVKEFLIEREFIQEMTIKNSVLICKLSTLFISEMKDKRIITKIAKNAFSLSSDQYKVTRITCFFENNLKIKQNEININTLIDYFKDTNKSRKKRELVELLDL